MRCAGGRLEQERTYVVYMLRCADGTLYTGITNDLDRRVRMHNGGKGAKYTRSRRPVELVYWEQAGCRADASRREYAVKRLTRAEKEALAVAGAGGMGRKPELSLHEHDG